MNRSQFFGLLGAVVVVTGTVSCGGNGVPLPGGYSVFIAGSSEMFLEEPKYGGSIPALGTDLEAIGAEGVYIFGRSGADRGSTAGYFLLDTRDGSIRVGLSEADWNAALGAAGIATPVELVGPARARPVRR